MALFDRKAAFQFAWKTIQEYFGFLIGLIVVTQGIVLLPEILLAPLSKSQPWLWGIGKFLVWLASMFVGAGLLKILIALVYQHKARFTDLFSASAVFAQYLIGTVLYGLLTVVGYLLLIVPGVIWGLEYKFVPYLLVHTGCSFQEAFQGSRRMTDGAKKDLLVMMLMILGINLIGALFLGIGLLMTVPMTMVAEVHVYKQLLKRITSEA